MKYYATALKSIFSDLINFDISNNLTHDHQLKQDMLENVWAAIYGLDKNSVHIYEIKGILDFLKDAIVFFRRDENNKRQSGTYKSYRRNHRKLTKRDPLGSLLEDRS